MSDKPDKLIPRLFRFTEDDIVLIHELRGYFHAVSDAAVVREALRRVHEDAVEAGRQ